MIAGGIVLCGGKSTRMGTSKALLPFGPFVLDRRMAAYEEEYVGGPSPAGR